MTDAVLARLESRYLADAMTGRISLDHDIADLASQLDADQGRLDELAGLYADGAISAREWITARDPITTRIQQTRDRITQVTALHDLSGTGHALHQQWGPLTLGLRQAIVQTILDHAVITPGHAWCTQPRHQPCPTPLAHLARH